MIPTKQGSTIIYCSEMLIKVEFNQMWTSTSEVSCDTGDFLGDGETDSTEAVGEGVVDRRIMAAPPHPGNNAAILNTPTSIKEGGAQGGAEV